MAETLNNKFDFDAINFISSCVLACCEVIEYVFFRSLLDKVTHDNPGRAFSPDKDNLQFQVSV